MSTIATSQGSDFKPAPSGTHPAVCIAVIDIGTQRVTYAGKDKLQHKLVVGWELDTDEKRTDGKPFVVWSRYTLSLSEKATLRHHLESWRGRSFTEAELAGFDVKNVLGKPCMLSLTHKAVNGSTYANVSAVSAIPARMKGQTPQPSGKTVYFDIDDPDMAVFADFGDRLKDTVRNSEEWKARGTEEHGGSDHDEAAGHDDSGVPF